MHEKKEANFGPDLTFTFTAREWQGLLVLIDLGVDKVKEDRTQGKLTQKLMDKMGSVLQPVIDQIDERVHAALP